MGARRPPGCHLVLNPVAHPAEELLLLGVEVVVAGVHLLAEVGLHQLLILAGEVVQLGAEADDVFAVGFHVAVVSLLKGVELVVGLVLLVEALVEVPLEGVDLVDHPAGVFQDSAIGDIHLAIGVLVVGLVHVVVVNLLKDFGGDRHSGPIFKFLLCHNFLVLLKNRRTFAVEFERWLGSGPAAFRLAKYIYLLVSFAKVSQMIGINKQIRLRASK